MKKSNIILYLAFFYIIISSNSASGQIINVQSLLLKEAKEGLTISLNGKGDFRKGNTDYLKAGLGAVFYYKKNKHNLIGTIKTDYAKQASKNFIKESFEHIRWRWWLWKKFGIELFMQHSYKPISRIQKRALFGVGIPFQLIKTNTWLLSGGMDLMFEQDEYSKDPLYTDSGQNFIYYRLDTFFTLAYTQEKQKIVFTLYYQPEIINLYNLRVLADFSFIVQINKILSLTTGISYHYDSVSPEGTQPYDLKIIWSLVGIIGPMFGE